MNLQDFLNNEEVYVKEMAALLIEAKTGFEHGDLTKEQYEEIAEDILQIERIDEIADTLERKNKILGAINTMKELAGFLPI